MKSLKNVMLFFYHEKNFKIFYNNWMQIVNLQIQILFYIQSRPLYFDFFKEIFNAFVKN
jgi:hypothetical protein